MDTAQGSLTDRDSTLLWLSFSPTLVSVLATTENGCGLCNPGLWGAELHWWLLYSLQNTTVHEFSCAGVIFFFHIYLLGSVFCVWGDRLLDCWHNSRVSWTYLRLIQLIHLLYFKIIPPSKFLTVVFCVLSRLEGDGFSYSWYYILVMCGFSCALHGQGDGRSEYCLKH